MKATPAQLRPRRYEVFGKQRSDALPDTWRGYPVIDGDEHDARFTDAGPGTIIGLLAKGRGKKDETGFVINI